MRKQDFHEEQPANYHYTVLYYRWDGGQTVSNCTFDSYEDAEEHAENVNYLGQYESYAIIPL